MTKKHKKKRKEEEVMLFVFEVRCVKTKISFSADIKCQ